MSKVLITGGAGFIGGHLAEYWLKQGSEVVVIDNFRSSSKTNIEHLKNVKLFEYSITDIDNLRKCFEGVDYVHHMAAMISVPESIENPRECVEININGLLNVLECCKEFGVKKIVHSSSAAVYGDNPQTPKLTSMRPEPKSPYGITKLDGEYYLEVYRENFGVNSTSLRHFNIFGPRQNPKSQYAAAVPIFITKALANQDLIIYGDGEQTRDFIYIADVVKANVLAVTNPDVYGTFNVGTASKISINDIAKLVIKLTSSKSNIIYKEERNGDIKHSLSSIEETKSALNFTPEWDLEKALFETINYFKNIM